MSRPHAATPHTSVDLGQEQKTRVADAPTCWLLARAVGRLTLRKDGWFSWDSGPVLGVLTTHEVPLPAKPVFPMTSRSEAGELELVLVLNILSSVRGVVRAALLHADSSEPLLGYACNDSVPLVGHNALQIPLRWNSHSDAQVPPAGTWLKLRIEATYTKIFTFQLAWMPPLPPPPRPAVVTRALSFNVDLFDARHGAYNHSYPSSPWLNKTMGALSCQAQCDEDPACRAWTYVEKATPGSPERCCFAASVGCPHHSDGIVSAAKTDGPCSPGAT